jgi:hypothetical protein
MRDFPCEASADQDGSALSPFKFTDLTLSTRKRLILLLFQGISNPPFISQIVDARIAA